MKFPLSLLPGPPLLQAQEHCCRLFPHDGGRVWEPQNWDEVQYIMDQVDVGGKKRGRGGERGCSVIGATATHQEITVLFRKR